MTNEERTKARSKLAHRQRFELDALAKDPKGNGYYGSCTNSTMNALKRRGLVDIQWTEIPGSIYQSERWVITDLGKEMSSSRP